MRHRILIVDDNPRFRRLVRRLLEGEGYEVVGAAESAQEALVAARELSPDLVLLDVSLPDGSGFEVAATISRERPEAVVLLTSTHGRSEFEQLAERSGARAFVPKDELSGKELARLLS